MKAWVKLYTELNRDPKIGSLSWAHRGMWSALLALCGELDVRDDQERETGALDTLENVAWHLRCDAAELEEALEAFRARGMIHVSDGILFLSHYKERQGRPASARPTAVKERVRRSRAKKRGCNDVTPSPKRAVTSSESESDTESDSDKNHHPPAADDHNDHDDADLSIQDHSLAEVMHAWEDAGKQLRPLDAERLGDLCQDHGPPAVLDAIKRANDYGAVNLAYIGRILENAGNGHGGDAGHARAAPRASPAPVLTIPERPSLEEGMVLPWWGAFLERMAETWTAERLKVMLGDAVPVSLSDGVLTIGVLPMAKDFLETRGYGDVQRALSAAADQRLSVRFVSRRMARAPA